MHVNLLFKLLNVECHLIILKKYKISPLIKYRLYIKTRYYKQTYPIRYICNSSTNNKLSQKKSKGIHYLSSNFLNLKNVTN